MNLENILATERAVAERRPRETKEWNRRDFKTAIFMWEDMILAVERQKLASHTGTAIGGDKLQHAVNCRNRL